MGPVDRGARRDGRVYACRAPRARPGEVTERPNVAVLKTAVRLAHRGFESPPLRSSNAITFRDTEFANEGKT